MADGGKTSIMANRYGTYRWCDLEPAIRAGTREAWRVARLGTVIKLCDYVHGSRYRRLTAWAIAELGEPYDVVHQVRPPLHDGKWREPQLSAYSNGSTYLIWRKDGPVHRRVRR
jgi:hypothetical protein